MQECLLCAPSSAAQFWTTFSPSHTRVVWPWESIRRSCTFPESYEDASANRRRHHYPFSLLTTPTAVIAAYTNDRHPVADSFEPELDLNVDCSPMLLHTDVPLPFLGEMSERHLQRAVWWWKLAFFLGFLCSFNGSSKNNGFGGTLESWHAGEYPQ